MCVCATQISTFSMVAAAIVEAVRLGQVHSLGLDNSTDPVPMSVFWLVPQYFIIGAAEIMVNIGTLEMFYSEVLLQTCKSPFWLSWQVLWAFPAPLVVLGVASMSLNCSRFLRDIVLGCHPCSKEISQ